jgi:hypothetical protein
MQGGRRFMAMAGGVLVLTGGTCGWLFMQFRAFEQASRPVMDVEAYERVLGEWKEHAEDIVGHFPEAIPGDAEDAGFYYWPGLFQSDARIELRLRMGREGIEGYYEAFSERATRMTRGAVLIHRSGDGRLADVIELGRDYVVMQFDEEPDDIPEHGKEHGVIISREKNEIIFWAEW